MIPASKANLARIRNNQRRSRARRKEYLQELEARLRQYELHGIETSVEIQIAARKVADENRKLRGLLLVHGIGDDNVEAYLQSPPTSDTLFASQFPSRSAPAQVLQHLLQKRKSFCSDGVIGVPMNGMGGLEGGGSSPTSVCATQSPWDSNRLSNPW
ncbi:hypothetical protein M430DRAFT_18958 [Amorphotheca resinae ATCC 22711]|uniref:BZIP domain-containing protein n=1 Tax=Amorphotheca resinae ATCC 22711 TaxID=857342 RepID=A0A2T3B1E8_AMORE|nr:hypothetical protein M430DRAFT_18958 [Amorphotheca resinae ATCC 22711]PSS18359.1 hypothetical protein M430DRAFT_18958 [Amorphotheca resinae ATCC 22711]